MIVTYIVFVGCLQLSYEYTHEGHLDKYEIYGLMYAMLIGDENEYLARNKYPDKYPTYEYQTDKWLKGDCVPDDYQSFI